MKYTEGPWEMVQNSWAITTICAPDKQGIICELTIDGSCTEETQAEFEEQQRVNAKLITSAPDLLEALKDASNALTSSHSDIRLWNGYKPLIERIDKVIKKAEQ